MAPERKQGLPGRQAAISCESLTVESSPTEAQAFRAFPSAFGVGICSSGVDKYASCKLMRITVLGAGAWGTAIAQVLSENGHQTFLWTWLADHAAAMNLVRENKEFLPGVPLRADLEVTSDMAQALRGSEVIVVVVPSHAVRKTMTAAAPHLAPGARFICASKGIEQDSLALMTEVIADSLTSDPILRDKILRGLGVLSGPSFAKEVARGEPTNLVAASFDPDFAPKMQEIFATDRLRIYTGDDPVGVEIGGALKNVIAIAAGACDGLGFGNNTRAALMTRGIAEMSRLVVAKGGKALTAAGLAGIGDLVLTCTGDLSRNRTLGHKLGAGMALSDALASSDGVAEGYLTSRSVHFLAKNLGVDLPICEAVYSVLHEGVATGEALKTLYSRPLGGEWAP